MAGGPRQRRPRQQRRSGVPEKKKKKKKRSSRKLLTLFSLSGRPTGPEPPPMRAHCLGHPRIEGASGANGPTAAMWPALFVFFE